MTKFDTRMLTVGQDMVMNFDESELGHVVREKSIEKGLYAQLCFLTRSEDGIDYVIDLYPTYADSKNVYLYGKENKMWSQFRIPRDELDKLLAIYSKSSLADVILDNLISGSGEFITRGKNFQCK